MIMPRVLIVDDDAQVCFVATRSLESIARCDAVHDVAAATHALAHDTYDLVLVDISLPGPSGMTLLDELRRRWPQTAALMLSGGTDLAVARTRWETALAIFEAEGSPRVAEVQERLDALGTPA